MKILVIFCVSAIEMKHRFSQNWTDFVDVSENSEKWFVRFVGRVFRLGFRPNVVFPPLPAIAAIAVKAIYRTRRQHRERTELIEWIANYLQPIPREAKAMIRLYENKSSKGMLSTGMGSQILPVEGHNLLLEDPRQITTTISVSFQCIKWLLERLFLYHILILIRITFRQINF